MAAVGDWTGPPSGGQQRRHVPAAPRRNGHTAELGLGWARWSGGSVAAEKHGSRGPSRPGQAREPAPGLGRFTSWEAWPAQASTTYQRPRPSRSQPEATVGSGQFSGLPSGPQTKRWQRPRSVDHAPA